MVGVVERWGVAIVGGWVGYVDLRGDSVRCFQQGGFFFCFVGNPAAAGAGLNLHRARIAIYESFSNQAAHYMQSLDRIHRRGQERNVENLWLICRGPIEGAENCKLYAKSGAQAGVIDGQCEDTTHTQVEL